MIKISEDNLSILNQSLEMVGKRDLAKPQLKEFINQTIEHEVKEFTLRREMFNNKKLENEMEINDFPFYTDGYRVGAFIELKDENIIPSTDKDGNEIQVRQLFKKNKNKEIVRDKNDKPISTGRCLMRIKGRRGFMSIFIGLSKVEELEEKHSYILVGGLTTSWKITGTTGNNPEDYHKKQVKETEYDSSSHTLNVWQIGEIVRTKGGKIQILLPECNWKEDK